MDSMLNMKERCALEAMKASNILGFIRRNRASRSREILSLCLTLVRPYLDYCVQFWDLQYKKDIDV